MIFTTKLFSFTITNARNAVGMEKKRQIEGNLINRKPAHDFRKNLACSSFAHRAKFPITIMDPNTLLMLAVFEMSISTKNVKSFQPTTESFTVRYGKVIVRNKAPTKPMAEK